MAVLNASASLSGSASVASSSSHTATASASLSGSVAVSANPLIYRQASASLAASAEILSLSNRIASTKYHTPVVDFTIEIEDIDVATRLYDKIQVLRSIDGPAGPYNEITDKVPKPAKLEGSNTGTWNLDGTELSIEINNAYPVTVSFSGTDPFDLITVLDAINDKVEGLAEETEEGSDKVALVSPIKGTGSALKVSGSAASVLGFPTTKVNGKGRRLTLSKNTEKYTLRDLDGHESYWYKWRLYDSSSGALSAESQQRQPDPEVVAEPGELATVEARIIDGAGRPIIGRRVIYVAVGQKTGVSDGKNNTYVALATSDRVETKTDTAGLAVAKLVRGMTFKVFLEGTSFHREFKVPISGNGPFELFSLTATSPDPFDIAVTPANPIKVTN